MRSVPVVRVATILRILSRTRAGPPILEKGRRIAGARPRARVVAAPPAGESSRSAPRALGVWSMSTRKPSPRNRALRPSAEDLENRQVLSAVVSGTDIDGDQWILRLIGPGSLVVAKQNGANGNPAPLNSQTQINSITIGGLNPSQSRLVGTVTKAADGDGKVFFQNLIELPSKSVRLSGGN